VNVSSFEQSSDSHPITIIAHRGLHDDLPENSIVAFSAAFSAGFDWVEFDVWKSFDGEPVVVHDETLDRTTQATGRVLDRTSAELGQIILKGARGRLRKWRLPIGMPLVRPALVEIKPPDDKALVARVVKSMAARGSPWMIQSFDSTNLVHAWAVDPKAHGAWLVETEGDLQKAIRERWPAVHAAHELLDERVVSDLRAAGCSVGAWTVNQERAARSIALLRPDKIITDAPLRVRRVISELAVAGISEPPPSVSRVRLT
jgi:glycerophosphoryl diester phosphodiesterase